MLLRAVAFILVCLLALAALIASNRTRPLIEAHTSGPRLFNQADYPVCVTVQLAPLQRPRPHGTNVYPRRSDTA